MLVGPCCGIRVYTVRERERGRGLEVVAQLLQYLDAIGTNVTFKKRATMATRVLH